MYKQAYELGKEPYDAYEVGRLYLWYKSCRDYELAREWLDIAVAGNYFRAHTCLAEYYYRGYDKDALDAAQAIYHAEQAVKLEANDSSAYRILAAAYANDAQYSRAVEAQQKAVELFKPSARTQRYFESMKTKLEDYRSRAQP